MRRMITAACVALLAATVPTAAARATTTRLTVGSVTLSRCTLQDTLAAWCGSIRVPLDYTDAAAGSITVGFGWRPATGSAGGTVVAQEGGPGYPSTGTAADFATMFGRSLETRNLLTVDARGTGRSTPIDCEPLQSLRSPSARFTDAVTACGRQLNATFPRAGGGFVHASDLFTTANTARDLARVLAALQLTRVDLYGDSYGTYFAQSFLARYPQLLRSVVLDSAYEVRDLDPWYRTTVSSARRAFDAVCRRALGCARGSSWTRIARLAARLRAHPVTGAVIGTDAHRHRVTVDVIALVDIVNDAGYDRDPYRQLDAAARALLGHHDATPLLRLYAQDLGFDYGDYSAPATSYSDGLYLAIACSDYPQLFDMHSSVTQRRTQLSRAVRQLPAATFAPFTTREWLRVLPYTETYTGCLTWPTPTHAADPPVPTGAQLDATHVPVLILNGEFDSLTPAAGGAHVARQLGRAARTVVASNTVHLVALENHQPCGSSLVQHFLAAPVARLDTACARRIPTIRAVPSFPRTLAQAAPAVGRAPLAIRRLASVAVAEAGDALVRFGYVDGSRDQGLRGGTVVYDAHGDATLRHVHWTVDTSVSGHVTATAHGGHAHLSVGGRTFTVSWGAGARASVTTGCYRLSAPAP